MAKGLLWSEPPKKTVVSFMVVILTGKSESKPEGPNPWTVRFVKLTMMPMEIGCGLFCCCVGHRALTCQRQGLVRRLRR
jgi:hypothetical protein